jgi:predicted ATP-grasp superfamily ATP-dependent carboligase
MIGNGTRASTSVPVFAFGGGLTALGVVRVLGAAGVPAFVIGDNPTLVSGSRWFRPAPQANNGVAPEKDLANYLDGLPVSRAVLIPCADAWALRLAALDGQITERFPTALAPVSVLEGLMDKGRLAQELCAADVPHPRTVLLKGMADLATISDDVLPMGFFKPRDSEHFFRRFGAKAFRVRSRDEAERRWREADSTGLALLFQEYIPGPPDRHYFLDGFVDHTGRVTAIFARRRLRMYPPDFGNSTLMASIPLSEAADARESLNRLFERVGFRGIFSAEFKRDVRDDRFKLLEVNVRPWWYVEFAARCGVDVVTMAYRDALKLPAEPVTEYRVGRRCVYPYYDYCAYRELRGRGRISFAAWVYSLFGASQPVFRWNDPYPAWDELRTIVRNRLQHAATR